ncbi:ATP-grasp domain-containing protein [Ilumatobacter sp.]|uniref:carboxylate--amine ligase n=1 Tax=Ilumatobacter sp. TaxID=1967498 RepID=UPI003AF95090
MSRATVLVTDAGLGSAVAVIRSLDRAGYRVIAADDHRRSAGLWSRHAAERLVYPSPRRDVAGFVACLADAVEREGVDIIVPVTDAAILPIDHHRHRFDGRCVLAMADREALTAAADKYRTAVDGEALGLTLPPTQLVRTVDEAVSAAADLGWPVVVKPRFSAMLGDNRVERRSVTYADSEAELRHVMQPLEGRCEVVLQGWCPGHGAGVDLLMWEGEPLLAFQHERLRELPVHGGPGALRRSVPLDPELYRSSVALLAGWGWSGIAMVEFRSSGSNHRLMEVNGRLWGSIPLSTGCGVDFPLSHVRLLLDGTPPDGRVGDYPNGFRARHLTNDVMWIMSVLSGRPQRRHPTLPRPRRRDAALAALELLDPRITYDVQSWRDPLPGAIEVAQMGRRVGLKLIGGRTDNER